MNHELKVTGRILQVSEATKKRNPELFGNSSAGICTEKPECGKRSEGQDRSVVESPQSLRYSITIVVCRKRLLDSHDNARSACKPLVDRITAALGFRSDDDSRLEWNYHQIRSKAVSTTILITTFPAVKTTDSAAADQSQRMPSHSGGGEIKL